MSNPLEDFVKFIFLAIEVAIPVFILFLLAKPLFHRILKRFKWRWLASSLLTTYIISLVLILLLYFTPLLLAGVQTSGYLPPDIQEQVSATELLQENLGLYVGGILRSIILAVFFTMLALPFEFLGLALRDYFSTKKWNPWIVDFAAVLGVVSVFLLVVIVVFPWLPLSLIYLLWFAG